METKTNVIKVRFGGQGKEYVYFTPETVEVGDTVEIKGIEQISTAMVTRINVPAEEIAAFASRAKSIVRKVNS